MIVRIDSADLTSADLEGLRTLFDAEYRQEFGAWRPEQPYGYAPHDVHIVAREDDRIVGHVGWARRSIRVGTTDVAIAGVGGVLVAESARESRLGRRLMYAAAGEMADAGGIDFGYLGCREAVVPFYVSCGWTRFSAVERSINRAGKPVIEQPGQPLLILPIDSRLEPWPDGEIDLRGRAW